MPSNFKSPTFAARATLGGLMLVNLIALYFVMQPIGGSPEDLKAQLSELQIQVRQRQATLERTRALVSKIEGGRTEEDAFLDRYFLPRRFAYSTILADLVDTAKKAGVRPKESSFASEPVEGSDNLSMMTITANYEGTYADLIHFVNFLDKTDRLIIVEGLQATPQQSTGGILSVSLKLDTFVREDGSAPVGASGQ